jgi:hypothetical protein
LRLTLSHIPAWRAARGLIFGVVGIPVIYIHSSRNDPSGRVQASLLPSWKIAKAGNAKQAANKNKIYFIEKSKELRLEHTLGREIMRKVTKLFFDKIYLFIILYFYLQKLCQPTLFALISVLKAR